MTSTSTPGTATAARETASDAARLTAGPNGHVLEVGGLQVLTSAGSGLLEVDGRLCAPGTEDAAGVTVDWTAREIDGPGAWELGMTVTNRSTEVRRVSRMDPLAADLSGEWATSSFRSAWGASAAPCTVMVKNCPRH